MTGYPWNSGDELDASDLNDAIASRAPAVALTNANAALAAADAATAVADGAVKRSGDTMTGPLDLFGDPTQPLHAATKQYVDASSANPSDGVVSSIAALRALTIAVPIAKVAGYYSPGDQGGGNFVYVTSDTSSVDDGGSIIVDAGGHRYYRQIDGLVTWKQFGAKGDATINGGGTDDTDAIQAAWNYSGANRGLTAFGSAGVYRTTRPLVIPTGSTIVGAAAYSAEFSGWRQATTINYQGNNSALVVNDPIWGGVTLEKIGFVGNYVANPAVVGLNLQDSVRTNPLVCGLVIRDCMFKWFATGLFIGNKYQAVWGYNLFIDSCSNIGMQVETSDTYWYMVTCGNSVEAPFTQTASVAQLYLGSPSVQSGPSGYHQFHGGAFFDGQNTIVIQNSNSNKFFGADIQNAINCGVVVGGASGSASGNAFMGCYFSGNNRAGGSANSGNTFFTDAVLNETAHNTRFIGNIFADGSGLSSKVAGAVNISPSVHGTIISGNTFMVDNMHNPSGTDAPFPLIYTERWQTDTISIEGNQYVSGSSSQTFSAQESQNQYVASGIMSLTPGTACLNGGASSLAMSLPIPGWIGRKIDIVLTSGAGTTVTSQTANGIGGNKTTATFTAAGAYLSLIAVDNTEWFVIASSNVTLS